MIELETSLLDGLGRVDAHTDTFTGVQVDSRRIAPGDLFVAVDRGSEFVNDALARGAAATCSPSCMVFQSYENSLPQSRQTT